MKLYCKDIFKGLVVNFLWDVIKGAPSYFLLFAAAIKAASSGAAGRGSFLLIGWLYFPIAIVFWYYKLLQLFNRYSVNRKYKEWVRALSNQFTAEEIDNVLSQTKISVLPWWVWILSVAASIVLSMILWYLLPWMALKVSFLIGHIL